MARSRIQPAQHVTPLALLVARAAATTHTGSLRGADLHAAVTELAKISRASIIENGVLASDAVRAAVDAVASRHLKRGVADRQLTRALRKVGDRQLRNAIEIAHDQVLEPSEVAHYYAGLMAGLAFLELSRNSS